MTERAHQAQVVQAPEGDGGAIWKRGLWMLVFALLFELGKSVMAVGALFQFVWMLVKGDRNRPIADFGADLGAWLGQVARFLTGASEDKPFPCAPWKAGQG